MAEQTFTLSEGVRVFRASRTHLRRSLERGEVPERSRLTMGPAPPSRARAFGG